MMYDNSFREILVQKRENAEDSFLEFFKTVCACMNHRLSVTTVEMKNMDTFPFEYQREEEVFLPTDLVWFSSTPNQVFGVPTKTEYDRDSIIQMNFQFRQSFVDENKLEP